MLKLHDLSDLLDDIELAWADTCDAIDDANRDAIQSPRYEWPRQTIRSDGSVVGSPRDIVDTAHLLESQSVERSGQACELSWGADYAAKVHEGETTKSGFTLPARRWTQEAISGDDTAPSQWQNDNAILDVPTHFANEFKRLSGLS
jgi:hypothetical protein